MDLLSDFDLEPTGTCRQGRPEYRLARPLSFEDVTVPAGFVVDGYSLPGRLVNLIWQPKKARWKTAATIHDWLYEAQLFGAGEDGRAQADAMFQRAMRASGVLPHHRLFAWLGVRLFGQRGYGLIDPDNEALVKPLRKDLANVLTPSQAPAAGVLA